MHDWKRCGHVVDEAILTRITRRLWLLDARRSSECSFKRSRHLILDVVGIICRTWDGEPSRQAALEVGVGALLCVCVSVWSFSCGLFFVLRRA